MKIFLIIIIFALTFLLNSCAPNFVETIRTTQYVSNYTNKSYDFIVFCIFLITNSTIFWSNIYSRLYYFYFTLAKIITSLKKGYIFKDNHDDVWAQNKVNPRKVFGVNFKKIRAVSDYDFIQDDVKFTKETNNFIIENHKEVFNELIKDLKKQINKYKIEFDINKLDELEKKHNELINYIKQKNGS